MHIQFISTGDEHKAAGLTPVLDLGDGIKAYLNEAQVSFKVKLDRGITVYVYGEVFYFLQEKSNKALSVLGEKAIKKIFSRPLADAVRCLEGQYVGFLVDVNTKRVEIFSDRDARQDCFYTFENNELLLSSDLDFIFKFKSPRYNQVMLAHMFLVYGWYTPKGFTIYNDVYQPRPSEFLSLTKEGLKAKRLAFKPHHLGEYGPERLEDYAALLRESIALRSQGVSGPIWVSSSSGWDSSIILAHLVDMYGPKRIRMLTGSMKYSNRTGEINRFEIDKVNRIGQFYGIKPHVVDLDCKFKRAVPYWQKIAPKLRSKHSYTITGFNFGRISDGIAQVSGPGQVVFNGETSDSFHNFGFSQFVTFFHTVKSFTEYGDKMNCYLYGPTFLSKVLDGTHQKDSVFRIFRAMAPQVQFDETWGSKEELLESYFLPIFYGAPRLPFARTMDNSMISPDQIKRIRQFMMQSYCPEFIKTFNPKTLYSWMIHLYQSMHSQGSTVNIHKHAMALNGHKWRSPFNDYRLMDFLSSMPESWGRGLELNHAKYPLKWVAKNRVRFPYDLLQEGPHSYLYDVIEGFSIQAEILYRSAMTSYFKEVLAQKSYRQIMDPSYFNMQYIDCLVDEFLKGKEAKGKDFTNIHSLVTLSITGWYGS